MFGILSIPMSDTSVIIYDTQTLLLLMWYPQGGMHSSSHWYYYFLLRRGREMLRPVCILTSRGLWLVVCLCSWNVSQQRAGISCTRFPEDFIYPASSGHAWNVCRSANSWRQDSGWTHDILSPPSRCFLICFLPGRLNHLQHHLSLSGCDFSASQEHGWTFLFTFLWWWACKMHSSFGRRSRQSMPGCFFYIRPVYTVNKEPIA